MAEPVRHLAAEQVAAHPERRREAPESRETTAEPLAPTTLADLLDLALSRDPATRAAWHEARAAAAVAGSRRAAYLPTIEGTGSLVRRLAPSGPRAGDPTTSLGLSAQLTWLLLDLGQRGALRAEAEFDLLAARLAHEVAGLDLALQVEETWYQYQAARALVAASRASLAQAQASLDAAEARRRAGVATIADVLQARTALSQLQLDAQRQEGQMLALRGSLASLAGLPPTADLEVGELPAAVRAAEALPEVERLLAEAARANPALARARALADAADARADAAARANLPSLALAGSAGRAWPVAPDGPWSDDWSAGLFLRIPLFEGGRTAHEALAAREAASAARARVDQASRRVALDVWTSLQGLRTAARRVDTSRDLLASASAGAEVAAARYQEGVGSILDLLSSQTSLEVARAEEILARGDWLVSLARLARATGRAMPSPDGALP
jgi:outer membrane protein TolC